MGNRRKYLFKITLMNKLKKYSLSLEQRFQSQKKHNSYFWSLIKIKKHLLLSNIILNIYFL